MAMFTTPRAHRSNPADPKYSEAASQAVVQHLVFISVVGADRVPVTSRLDRAMFGYFASKLAAERVVAEGNGFVPEVMLPRLLGQTSREHRPEVVEKVTALILEQAPEAIAGAQRGMAARSATTDVLASIKVPTLVVTGEEDAVTGPEIGRELAAAIPGARFLLVEEAGHLVNLEQPEIVNEALLDFLAPLWI